MRRKRRTLPCPALAGLTILACVLPSLAGDPAPPASESLSIRVPDKSLAELAEEEKREQEAALHSIRDVPAREREAIAEIERKRNASEKSYGLQIAAANQRIKLLRARMDEIEKEIVADAGEIAELDEKADRLEREAESVERMPDIVQPGGFIYSNSARADELRAEAAIHRTRADSRRSHIASLLRQARSAEDEIRRLRTGMQQNMTRRESAQEKYRREIEEARAMIRQRAIESLTTEDLLDDPGLLRQFNLGREMEELILDFAQAASDSREVHALDLVLAAIETELRDADFARLVQENSRPPNPPPAPAQPTMKHP